MRRLFFVAITGFLVAPPIVRWQAERILTRELGRATTIDKVAINPFAPSITLTGFTIGEADAAQPFVSFDELYVRASYTSLLRFAPVIATPRGSVPEVVEDGVTGWIVDVEDYPAQAADRLTRLSEIDPLACRDRVQRLFSKEAMVAGYEKAFERAVSAS